MEDDLAQYYFARLNSSTGDHPKEKGFLLPDARCHGVYIDIIGEELETQLQSCRNKIISRDDLNVNLVVRLGSAMVCQTVSKAFIGDVHCPGFASPTSTTSTSTTTFTFSTPPLLLRASSFQSSEVLPFWWSFASSRTFSTDYSSTTGFKVISSVNMLEKCIRKKYTAPQVLTCKTVPAIHLPLPCLSSTTYPVELGMSFTKIIIYWFNSTYLYLGKDPATKLDDFLEKCQKKGGGPFQSKNLSCRFWEL